MRRLFCLIATLAAFAGAAHAETPAPTTGSIQAAIDGSLADLLGSAAPPHVLVEPAGDAWRITIPAGMLGVLRPDGQQLASLVAQPTNDGSWALSDITLASPATWQVGGKRAPTTTLRISMESQVAQGVVDPSFQRESELSGNWRGLEITSDTQGGTQQGGGQPSGPQPSGPQHGGTAGWHQTRRIDSFSASLRLRPTPDGRVTLMHRSDADGFSGAGSLPDGSQMRMTVAHSHSAGHLDGIERAEVGPFIQAVLELGAALHPPGDDAARRASLHALVLALRQLASGVQMEQTADDLRVQYGDQPVALAHVGVGMSAEAPGGLLQARFDLELDGLTADGIPPAIADLLPRHLALRPTIAGLNLAMVSDRILAVTDPAGATLAPLPSDSVAMVAALSGPDGLVVGMDSLTFDLGPATIAGNGRLVIMADRPVQGRALFTASGLDALIDRVGQTPSLQPALGVLLMLKGLGRSDGERLVWALAFQNGRATVNGTDLTAMVPGLGK
jgi:hypothetical protein